MEIELLVHGVLSGGQTFWKNQDTKYLEQFYRTDNPYSRYMRTEVREGEKGWATYYTYARCNNIQAGSGRTGSYFGMTLRITGALYANIPAMYNLLDLLFEHRVLGVLLSQNGNSYQYLFDDYSQKDKELKELENALGGMIKSLMKPTDFSPLAAIKANGTLLRINTEDLNANNAKTNLLQGVKIIVSNEIQRLSLANAEKKAKEENQRLQQKYVADLKQKEEEAASSIKRCQTLNVELAKEKEALIAQVKTLQDNQSRLNSKNQQLQVQLQQKQNTAELAKAVKEIKEPIKDLSRRMAQNFPDSTETPISGSSPKGGTTGIKKTTKKEKIKALVYGIATLFLVLSLSCSAYTAYWSYQTNKTATKETRRIKKPTHVEEAKNDSTSSYEAEYEHNKDTTETQTNESK